jgi:hypothetical protein
MIRNDFVTVGRDVIGVHRTGMFHILGVSFIPFTYELS